MKVIVFSDLHCHDYKQFNEDHQRVRNAVGIIEYLFKLANANGIGQIWFAGDMGDQFANISVIAMNAILRTFSNCFKEYPEIEFIAIPGNHDFATKNTFDSPGISLMDSLEAGPYGGLFHNFILLSSGEYSHEDGFTIVGVPYYENMDDFWKALQRNSSNISYPDNAYLLMHQTVWPDNAMVQDDLNYMDKRLAKFKWIFNGHIHFPSMLGNNFISVGSPLHRDAGDIDNRKKIWILDTNSDDLPGFKDITDRNPQFIRKPYGEAITLEQEGQYIQWFHPADKKKKKDTFDSSKFDSQKVSDKELVKNYLDQIGEGLEYPKADLYGVAVKVFK